MVGAVERDEALGVSGGDEQAGGIVDADGLVERRVEDQQVAPQPADDLVQPVIAQPIDEALSPLAPAAADLDPCDTVPPAVRQALGPVLPHMGEGRQTAW